MVGLLISLLVVLAMLFVYKGTLNTVFGTRDTPGLIPSAQQDGQLASGLLSAQIALQEAGFGIPGATIGKEFILLSGASFDAQKKQLSGTVVPIGPADVSGNAMVFESDPNLSGSPGTRECIALLSDAGDGHGLYLLKATAPCSPVGSNLSSLTWTSYTLVADRAQPVSIGLAAHSSATCWPFGSVSKDIAGVDPPNGPGQLSITYRNSTTGTSTSGASTTLVVCLTNFQT